jgi:hypothetical protein
MTRHQPQADIPSIAISELHQGRWCYGKTPMQTFLDALPIARAKLLPAA